MSIRKLGIGGLATVLWVMVIGALALPALAASVEPESLSVTEVSSSSATLNATVDPEGAETSYVFEYAKSKYAVGSTPAGSVEVGAGSAGSGAVGVLVSVHVQHLEPSTTYYYRVVVAGVDSEAGSFITQESGDAFVLPEGRAWELVSPPNKHGAGVEAPFEGGTPIQAAEGGGAITYLTNGPLVSDPQGNRAFEYSQELSTRGADGGWETQDLTTPNTSVSNLEFATLSEYKMFSPELTSAVLEPKGNTPLPPLPPTAEKTIYLRDNATSVFTPLVTANNVLPGAKFGQENEENVLRLEGAAPDLSDVVFSSPEALTDGAVRSPDQSAKNLYEWEAGKLRLVSVLPPNTEGKEESAVTAPEVGEISIGYKGSEGNERGAVSSDGERVVWGVESGNGRHLYLRDMGRGETIQLDVPHEAASGGDPEAGAVFQAASSTNSDGPGMRIFFTDRQRLTRNAHAEFEEPDLYVFEVTSGAGEPLAGTLTDLTPDTNGEERASVQGGVIGYSEDGADVYFVANGALSSGAIEGNCREAAGAQASRSCNLYHEHYGINGWEEPQLVARLSGEDRPDWGGNGRPQDLGEMTARVSPNGQYLAFMSLDRLTGYDNRDVKNGTPDEEVFLYDAGAGTVACASCDPTGARPEGVYDPTEIEEPPLLVDRDLLWGGRWLGGSIPSWYSLSSHHAAYQPRYLSDSGELFFDSPSPLVPADAGSVENVYSYRPASNVGGEECDSETQSAAEVFRPESETEPAGCVSLISSGTSTQESVFLDASASGQEVFFMTTAQLVSQDTDSAYDVYDAHVCTAESPCPAGAGTVPPACNTADSCRTASAPQPAIFGSPASATFSGAGNTTQPAVADTLAVKQKTATQVRAEKLAKALKACRKKPRGAKRTSCEKQARKRYGIAKAKKASDKRGAK